MSCCTARVSVIRNIAVALFLSAALWAALISFANAEVIRSFTSDIVINEDSSFVVTETIVYDFQGEQRHGIFRNIKNRHPQEASTWYKTRYIEIEPISVARNGQPEQYTLEQYDGMLVKIGDPNRYLSGIQTYQIMYRVEGGLAQYDDGVELYWNVTGDEWEVIIEKAAATVKTLWNNGLSANGAACYVGKEGATERCIVDSETAEATRLVSGQSLFGEHMTIAQRLHFNGDIVIFESINSTLLFLGISLLGLIGLGMWIYRWLTAYKIATPVIAQYEPLPNFNPMMTGVLFDGKLDARDITAGIVYLAQRGYIKIRQTSQKILFFKADDYVITVEKPITESEKTFDDEIMSLLFGYAQSQGGTVTLSAIKKDSGKLTNNQRILRKLKSTVANQLQKEGFFESRKISQSVGIGLLLLLCLIFVWMTKLLSGDLMMWLFILTTYLVFRTSERRTKKGYEALNYLKGFKDFLATTEKERYAFHNAPVLSPEQFMEYLPYAIAFGVEKQWAEVFKDIQITPPDWYQNSAHDQFNAAVFTAGLSSFSTALTTATGTSGSSGSGRAGGGGGGGGGGSW